MNGGHRRGRARRRSGHERLTIERASERVCVVGFAVRLLVTTGAGSENEEARERQTWATETNRVRMKAIGKIMPEGGLTDIFPQFPHGRQRPEIGYFWKNFAGRSPVFFADFRYRNI